VTLSYELSDALLPLAPVKYDAWAAQEFREFMGLLDEAAARRNARTPEGAPGVVADVRKAISAGCGTESDVARQLSLSPATLRRRLAGAGSSFRTLADETQRNIAATLLMTDTSLEDIAAASRYSDVRSFRRACLRWFGMSPAAYRRALR
jgi:AraC-like DNA-binding protein